MSGPFAVLRRPAPARPARVRHVVLDGRELHGSFRTALCGRSPRGREDARWADAPPELPACRVCWALAQGPKAPDLPEGISRSGMPWVEPGEPEYAAAVLYARECGWDFAPTVLADQAVRYLMARDGRLVGFAIAAWVDYVGAGRQRTVEHLWTALPHRRQGIARTLVEAASADGLITHYSWPLTADGEAFVRSRPERERRFARGAVA